ncbi:unnamed protein product [Closterium sp. NIES-54]
MLNPQHGALILSRIISRRIPYLLRTTPADPRVRRLPGWAAEEASQRKNRLYEGRPSYLGFFGLTVESYGAMAVDTVQFLRIREGDGGGGRDGGMGGSPADVGGRTVDRTGFNGGSISGLLAGPSAGLLVFSLAGPTAGLSAGLLAAGGSVGGLAGVLVGGSDGGSVGGFAGESDDGLAGGSVTGLAGGSGSGLAGGSVSGLAGGSVGVIAGPFLACALACVAGNERAKG